MLPFNRRQLVFSAAAAGTIFGLARPLEIIPSALAQTSDNSPLNPKGLQFHKFNLGEAEITTIFDGAVTRQHADGFVKNASTDDIKASLRKAGMPDAAIPNTYTVTVVRIGDNTIMFDSGNGAGRSPTVGLLRDNLKAADIDIAKLTAIAVTHFHPDHIFGLFAKDDAPLYGDLPIIVPEAEYKFWSDPGIVASLSKGRQGIAKRVQASMPKWKSITQVATGKEIVPGIRSVATNRHTPGHTSYMVTSADKSMLVLGDVTSIPPLNLANPGWHVVFDQDAQLAEATRRKTFDQAIADKTICTGYHWGMPGAGTIVKDGTGYALVPVA